MRRLTEANAQSASASLRYYDFFAGAGLVRLALEPEWSCVWANDHDRRKARVYAANFGPEELVVDDVTHVRPEALPLGAQMAWASFPCQDLSVAGLRKGMHAPRSGTFWTFWRIMRDLHERGERPPLLVIENVPGLTYGDHFTRLCEGLTALDLQFGALVLDACWFVPQSRPRVFVVVVDMRLDCARFQQRTPGDAPWFP